MNREIVTQGYLDKRKHLASSIKQKINRTVSSDPVIVNLAQEGNKARGTIQGNPTIEDLLNEDLEEGTPTVRDIKLDRIQKLEEVNANVQKEQSIGKDGYADKLVKYIPSEAIVFYLTLTGILANTTDASKTYYSIGLLVVGLFGTVLYLKSVWKIRSNVQIIISCIAFLAWALSLDKTLDVPPTLQALMLPIVTFILPLIDPPAPKDVSSTLPSQ
jgi:hypothetical protein